ncbi:hypothetical protein AABM38_10005 [Heyndrickxia sp. MSNUG]|uniref:hypothetical protein n=1 Tax=Heyndrickxia sp. MSNUG TaxID=3136677 RepID=UPI003C2F5F06
MSIEPNVTLYLEKQDVETLKDGGQVNAFISSDYADLAVQVSVPLSWIDGTFYDNSNFLKKEGFIVKQPR